MYRTIGDRAFAWCKELFMIKIPDGVKNIDKWTSNDAGIISVELPEGLLSIGDYAFYGCPNLHEITIPDSVTEIGKEAFVLCGRHFSIRSGPNSYATRYARRNSIRRRVPKPKDVESGHKTDL